MSVKKKYNQGASPTNVLKIDQSESGCCGSELDMCKYTLVRTVAAVTGFKLMVGGVETEVLFTSVSVLSDVRKAIAQGLEDNGYNPYGDDDYKSIRVEAGEINIIGEANITAIKMVSTFYPTTSACVPAGICKVKGFASVGVDAVFLFNAATDTINEVSGALTITALEGLTLAGLTIVKTETNEGDGGVYFTYHIEGANDSELLKLDGSQLAPCGCYPGFTA